MVLSNACDMKVAIGPSLRFSGCLLLALFGHPTCTEECPLSGARRTVTNRCLPISIYEYTAQFTGELC